jgi:hypothetical protein
MTGPSTLDPGVPAPPATPGERLRRLLGGRFGGGLWVALVIGAYYWIFVLPPRLIGVHDPDRSFHLALSTLIAKGGFPRTLPQVEDLGWGRYFPDKEFLFHVLTGAAERLGGSALVIGLIPVLGLAILLCLYTELSRRLKPWQAVVFTTAVPLLTSAYMFRTSLLRPHLLAILFFCGLLVALLRERPRLAALAAAGFALSYHGFYIVGLVAVIAFLMRRQPGFRGQHGWAWCLAGLVAGIILNPYFPSNLVMGLLTLRLATGAVRMPPGTAGLEMVAYSWTKLAITFGFIPASLLATAVAMRLRKPAPGPEASRVWFLVLVTAGFWALGVKSPRAMEYAVPACILLVGFAASVVAWRGWVPLVLVLLVGLQGYVGWIYYRESWSHPPVGFYRAYAEVLAQVPVDARGKKVFNCEWAAGAYILRARPDLRFVDLLEPALLWDASHEKFLARQQLLTGTTPEPWKVLREQFKADYVLCSEQKLIKQMDANRRDFAALPGTQDDPIRLFALRPE